MAQRQDPVIVSFLGGLNTAFRVSDVPMVEAAEGQNFDLDADFAGLNRRPSLDALDAPTEALGLEDGATALGMEETLDTLLLLQTTLASELWVGYAQLVKSDGSISTLLQSGTDGSVYEWDLSQTLTQVGTVNPGARLRGSRKSAFQLDDYVVITDLALIETVKRWDGTTFEDLPHNLSSPLKAKYALIELERLLLANVISGAPTPHVLLGSKVSDPTTLTITDRPSSTAAFDDPFFLAMPDLKAINGMEQAFGQHLLSTENAHLYLLSGVDARDFAIEEFHFGSAVSGDEAMTNMGNDILLGPPGRIESLVGVIQFGDVRAEDVSRKIRPSVRKTDRWRMAYNGTEQKVYCIPENKNEMWVLHKTVLFGRPEVSPWSRWVSTSDALDTNMIMTLLDSNGSTETTYVALPSTGLVSLLGTTGLDVDDSITMRWRSGLIRVPPDEVFDVSGWVNYRKLFPASFILRFIFGGVADPSQDIRITIPQGQSVASVYGGAFYYNEGGNQYGSQFAATISRQNFGPVAGQSNHVQLEVEYTESSDIQIEEVGLSFQTASTTAAP